ESVDDAFVAGHSSTSISVATGMAKARTLMGEDYDVVAVIGDGAMTGGLAYEGLEDASSDGEPMVIILNDNNMSISPNVGGMHNHLSSLRYRVGYINFKRIYRHIFRNLPKLYKFNHRVKEWLKSWFLTGNTFVEMGFEYIGPVDGHNVAAVESALRLAKDIREPVIVHVVTQKGKGCSFAQEHPDRYHGVGPYDPTTGAPLKPSADSFSDKFGQYICEFAEKDTRVAAITAAMCDGTGLNLFHDKFPERFIDIGIAESHATAMAAGMAKQGMLPVFAVYSSFLQRAYDMLIHDVSLQNLHVVFGVDRAGLVGNDGETHHGVFDVSYLGSVPDMTIFCPASFAELHDMFEKALFGMEGPAAIRYPRGGEGIYKDCHLENEAVVAEGSDVTIVAYGIMINEALKAREMLSSFGISAEIVKLACVKPNDFDVTLESLKKTGRLIVSEDVCAFGCVGSRIMAAACKKNIAIQGQRLLNLGEGLVPQGTVAELLRDTGLDAQGIAEAAKEIC
ncbi:MAG: 1-deoxy-D-xylulose-5-phosphate synthase, partial [Clostridia bacterium]|nr:1-deoxy-D-xylulose-5-phosphate synthase [Clostridia bacterium]